MNQMPWLFDSYSSTVVSILASLLFLFVFIKDHRTDPWGILIFFLLVELRGSNLSKCTRQTTAAE